MGEYTWTKSKYILFQSQWGIVIWLEAGWQIVSGIEDNSNYTKLTDRIYFQPMFLPYPDSLKLTADELQHFCDGLKMISKYLYKLKQEDSYLIIALRSIRFSDCNAQIEGFTAAAIHWASETFHFPMPTIKVYFDRLKSPCGRYVFDFSSV